MNPPRFKSNQPRPPRTEARHGKINALTPKQRQSLVRWLTTDKVAYAVAQARMLKEFKISISTNTLCRFWQRHCAPPLLLPAQDVLLDVVIQSTAPVRLIVKQKNGCITLIQKP